MGWYSFAAESARKKRLSEVNSEMLTKGISRKKHAFANRMLKRVARPSTPPGMSKKMRPMKSDMYTNVRTRPAGRKEDVLWSGLSELNNREFPGCLFPYFGRCVKSLTQ